MNAPQPIAKNRDIAECTLAGQPAILDMSGALYLPSDNVLIVADMHLEKSTSGAKRGIFLPPYDSRITLELLSQTATKFNPARVVFLGDSFHDGDAPARLDADCCQALQSLAGKHDLIWVTGNHDPEIPQSIASHCLSELSLAGLHLTHIPQVAAAAPQISGHLHPVATVTGRGRSIRRRCFASDGTRMILPAFGAYTGGLNIRDKAFDNLFARGQLIAHVIGSQGIYSLPVTASNR